MPLNLKLRFKMRTTFAFKKDGNKNESENATGVESSNSTINAGYSSSAHDLRPR